MGINLAANFTMNAGLPLDDREVVANTIARDAIPTGRRYEGLTVYVENLQKKFTLTGGLTNANWVEDGNASGALSITTNNLTWTATGTMTSPILITTTAPHGLKSSQFVRLLGDMSGTGQVGAIIDEYNFMFPGGGAYSGPLTGYLVPEGANAIYDRVTESLKIAPSGENYKTHTEPQITGGLAFSQTLDQVHYTIADSVYHIGDLTLQSGYSLNISANTTYTIL